MSAPPSPPTPDVPARGAQVALGVFLSVLVGLLAFRAYGDRLRARPTESASGVDLVDLNSADRNELALVDLNSADRNELAQVPGIGPKTADAIVDHRRAHGPFKSVDELLNVRGIGPTTFEKVRHQLRTGPAPAAPTATVSTSSSSPMTAQKPTASGARKIQAGEAPINVNTASADELQRLPGVGPVTAQAIVAARAIKAFESVNDLDRAKGIGPKTLERLRPFVVVK